MHPLPLGGDSIAGLGSGQGLAAVRHFVSVNDRIGSVASHPDVRDAPGMSAMPSIATASVRRNKTLRCAMSGCEQSQQVDHLVRSEEHTSELQSLRHLVCRLLLEKKKTERL